VFILYHSLAVQAIKNIYINKNCILRCGFYYTRIFILHKLSILVKISIIKHIDFVIEKI